MLHPATIAALLIGAVLATVKIDFIARCFAGARARLARPAFALGDTARDRRCSSRSSILSVAAGSYSPFLYFRF